MALEHIIDFNCPTKEELGLDKMMEIQKNKARIHQLTKLIKRENPDADVDQQSFELTVQTPNGSETKTTLIGDLKNEIKKYEGCFEHCKECPANAALKFSETAEEMGCFQSLHYPIDSISEQILSQTTKKVIENQKENPLAYLIIKFIEDNGISGEPIRDMRSAQVDVPFFEVKSPFSVAYGGFMSKKSINTDQIWEVLTYPEIPPAYSQLISAFLYDFYELAKDSGMIKQSSSVSELIILGIVFQTAFETQSNVRCFR